MAAFSPERGQEPERNELLIQAFNFIAKTASLFEFVKIQFLIVQFLAIKCNTCISRRVTLTNFKAIRARTFEVSK